MPVYQLEYVCVAAQDNSFKRRLYLFSRRLQGNGADNIVCLKSPFFVHGHMEHGKHLLYQGHLTIQFVWRLFSLCFVRRKLFIPETSPCDIKGGGNIVWLKLFDSLKER